MKAVVLGSCPTEDPTAPRECRSLDAGGDVPGVHISLGLRTRVYSGMAEDPRVCTDQAAPACNRVTNTRPLLVY